MKGGKGKEEEEKNKKGNKVEEDYKEKTLFSVEFLKKKIQLSWA